MGIWQLIFVGLVGFIILYAWVIGEAENHAIPIIILLVCSIALIVGMSFLGQWYFNIGAFCGAVIGTSLAYWGMIYDNRRARLAYYTDFCWHCHKRIDRRQAKACPKCQKHYICPHCGKCLCDKPDYDPEKDDSKQLKVKIVIKPKYEDPELARKKEAIVQEEPKKAKKEKKKKKKDVTPVES